MLLVSPRSFSTWGLLRGNLARGLRTAALVLLHAEPNGSFAEAPLTASPVTPPLYGAALLAFSHTQGKKKKKNLSPTAVKEHDPAHRSVPLRRRPFQLKAC